MHDVKNKKQCSVRIRVSKISNAFLPLPASPILSPSFPCSKNKHRNERGENDTRKWHGYLKLDRGLAAAEHVVGYLLPLAV